MLRLHTHLVLLLLATPIAFALPTKSIASPAGPPIVKQQPDGVHIVWQPALETLRFAHPGAETQPLSVIGGLKLPAQTLVMHIAGDAPIAPRINRLSTVPWNGVAPRAGQPIPNTPAGEPRPDLAIAQSSELPASPVVVLREARERGERIAVLALVPVFQQSGASQAVRELNVTIPEATLSTTSLKRATVAPAVGPGPTNSAVSGWKIDVSHTGIQRLTPNALASAGVPLANPSVIHLYHNGQEIALEQRGSGASLELRFFAPTPGDRWNHGDTYWLRVDATSGQRIPTRSAMPGTAALRTIAFERGEWHGNTLYDPYLPGNDGDHWYAADLKTGPGLPDATLSVPLTPTLPLIAGTTVLTVTGGAYTDGQHTLDVMLGPQTQTTSWSGVGSWEHVFTFSTTNTNATLKLVSGGAPDGVEPDGVAWHRTVGLNVGGKGVFFDGVPGKWQYKLTNTPAGRTLYDVTDSSSPVILTIPGGVDAAFEAGPDARSYVLTGPNTLWSPDVSRSTGYDFTTPANALYIAPKEFHAALAPLVAQRRAQGKTVRIIDVQAIYNAWSFGQVAPEAIRSFLRYAAGWNTPPVAVTLVGDGTSDPLNYTGRNNTNFIPPYLAMVDPWLGETACEACYARLDGPDPTQDALPDLMLGRLPVKSASELSALVAKLVAYETTPLDVSWRSRHTYIADNADTAGDFAGIADASALQQPAGTEIRQLYYDPFAAHVPWRESDPVRAYQRTIDLLNDGAAVVNYIGHGGQYQWGTTDPQASPPYLLGLYDPDALTNGPRQPILLEMTCLTGAFQTPAFSGTTIDERFLLKPDGGAIAVWAPTGQGVAHGHDLLQRGFYKALWAAPNQRATVGRLVMSGYQELFNYGTCCQDVLATYALLGDPLTLVRLTTGRYTYVPIARRL